MTNKQQTGFVAIFTTLFFILLTTVITVGFLRIMGQEQRQSTDNDLSASALASAESGIEDGKRAILRYESLGPGALKTDYAAALNSNTCNALFGSQYSDVANDLLSNQSNGPGQLSTTLAQAYTCLTVQLNTPDYINNLDAGKSDYIPLRGDSNFDSITVSWHETTSDGEGQPKAYPIGAAALYPVNDTTGQNNYSWSSQGFPSYLRVQIFGYPSSGFNLGSLDNLDRTVILAPTQSTSGGFTTSNPINLETSDSRDPATGRIKSSPMAVACQGTPPNVTATYACSVKINLSGAMAPAGNVMFARITPIYGPTHFKVQLTATGGTPQFKEVQPIVDATGRANDVFRRVQARVRLDGATQLPEYTTETAQSICKDFLVTNSASDFTDNCSN